MHTLTASCGDEAIPACQADTIPANVPGALLLGRLLKIPDDTWRSALMAAYLAQVRATMLTTRDVLGFYLAISWADIQSTSPNNPVALLTAMSVRCRALLTRGSLPIPPSTLGAREQQVLGSITAVSEIPGVLLRSLASRSGVHASICANLLQGKAIQRNALALVQIRKALDIDPALWSEVAATEITGVPRSLGREHLAWTLYRQAFERDLTPVSLAEQSKESLRSCYALFAKGSGSEDFIARVGPLLGITVEQVLLLRRSLVADADSAGDEQVRTLIGNAMREHNVSMAAICRHTRLPDVAVRGLIKGVVPPRTVFAAVPRLSEVLSLDLDRTCHVLAQAASGGSDRGLGYLVRRALYKRGWTPVRGASACKIRSSDMQHLMQGSPPSHEPLQRRIVAGLSIPWTAWTDACRHETSRKRIVTQDMAAVPHAKPLRTLILAAASESNKTVEAWADAAGIRAKRVRLMVYRGEVPHRRSILTALRTALRLSETELQAALRLQAELNPSDLALEQANIAAEPRNGVQEALQTLMSRQVMTVAQVAQSCGVNQATLRRILDGYIPTNSEVLNKVRIFLDMDWITFEQCCRNSTAEDVGDAAEMKLLSLFRRMGTQQQARLLLEAENILAG